MLSNAIDSMAAPSQSNRGVIVQDVVIGGITSRDPISNEALGVELNAFDFSINRVFITRVYNVGTVPGNASAGSYNIRASAIEITNTTGGCPLISLVFRCSNGLDIHVVCVFKQRLTAACLLWRVLSCSCAVCSFSRSSRLKHQMES